ncbi:MAG: hypothetical protein ACI9G1_002831 [Pirellulaceae bacterium]|jgi:hypothetical protein
MPEFTSRVEFNEVSAKPSLLAADAFDDTLYFIQAANSALPTTPPFPDRKARPALVLRGGSYVDIDGVDDYFRSMAKLTVECWVRPVFASEQTGCTLFSVMSDQTQNISIRLKISILKKSDPRLGNAAYISSTVYGHQNVMHTNVENWTHVAWVFDGQYDDIYINGKRWSHEPRRHRIPGGVLRLGSKELTTSGQFEADSTARLEIVDFRISEGARYAGEAVTPPVEPLTSDASTSCLLDFSKPSNVIADASGHNRVGRARGGRWHMVDAARSGRLLPNSDKITIRNVNLAEPFVETKPNVKQNTGLALYRKHLVVENTASLIEPKSTFTAEMWYSVYGSDNWTLLSATSPATSTFTGITRSSWVVNYKWHPSLSAKHGITWAGRRGSISWTTKKTAQRWRHLAVCYDGANLSVFLDGTFFGRADSTGHQKIIKEGWPIRAADLIIGSTSSSSSSNSPLIVHSFRLSTNVRYHQSFDPPGEFLNDAATASILRFDNGVDNLRDLSNNNRNGKLSNDSGAWVEYSSPAGVASVNLTRTLSTGGANPSSVPGPSVSNPSPTPGGHAVPPIAELDVARKEFHDVFGADVAKAITPASRRSLARRFSALAEATTDFDAVRYVLYMESARMGLKANDRQTALQSLNSCERYFNSDMTRQIIAVYEASAKSVPKAEAVRLAADVIREVESALRDENTEKANALVEVANTAATKSRDTTVRKRVKDLKDKCEAMATVIDSFKAGEKTLLSNPADPQAIEAVACYHYNFKRDWKVAATVLEKHPSVSIQEAVKAESDEKLSALPLVRADIWAKSISSANTQLDVLCASRAVYWYQRSLSQLAGLEKLQAEKRIKTLKETHQLD